MKIKPISIKEYICGNCSKLVRGECLILGKLKHEKDIACSQIFQHFRRAK